MRDSGPPLQWSAPLKSSQSVGDSGDSLTVSLVSEGRAPSEEAHYAALTQFENQPSHEAVVVPPWSHCQAPVSVLRTTIYQSVCPRPQACKQAMTVLQTNKSG
eukprot:TRINITY_DN10382_c0_g2_i1.p2 TRINITY_DN10382_c0_g2~~TRINITY_DN10382_c0_g2_i1.p2  ORF type:complete len:103 (+),score=2.77 TRINITY_DN10382_c0_g2_i1:127-435(+)